MTDKNKERLKKFIMKRARKVAPVKSPEVCFAVAALMVFGGWLILPNALMRLYFTPIFGNFFRLIPFSEHLAFYGGWVLALVFTYLATYPICRGIQLCFPDEYEAYESEKDLAY